ncbi:MAG: alpha-hydroxy-acid oxidizing protein [Bryobacteraceae bacterium]|nr:alpha-hydroxy-acid oxidizing protein [Bryobacteraceae bacterium]
MTTDIARRISRRRFLEYVRQSPLFAPLAAAAGLSGRAGAAEPVIGDPVEAINVFDFMPPAQKKLSAAHWAYLMTGVDDNRTVEANSEGFRLFQIRPRGFVNVETVDTSVELYGTRLESPIVLAPVGHQRAFHPEAELAVARAAREKGHQVMLSTFSSVHVREVAEAHGAPLWFQLYPTSEWSVTEQVLRRAEDAGCPVVALTIDAPAGSNRETLRRLGNRDKNPQCGACHRPGAERFVAGHPTFAGIDYSRVRSGLRSITLELVERVRRATKMKIVAKGVMTAEDAELCVKEGLDGIVVSNHGGRQAESLLSTIEALPEVTATVNGKIPVLIDGGFRRGTDVFKALAIGADAICIGRPYLWGLSAFGQAGVERVLELLQAELVTTMKQSGANSLDMITSAYVKRRSA